MTVKAAFIDLTNLDRFDFDYNPDMIDDGKGNDVDSPIIPGASLPRTTVNAGNARIINFTVRLARSLPSDALTLVRDQSSWLMSVMSPYPTSSVDQEVFTPLQFVWGDLYDIPVILRKARTKHLYFRPEDALPEWADMELSLEVLSAETINTPEIRNDNQGFVRYLTT